MDPDRAWEDVTAALLLGTERKPYAPPSTPGPLGSLLGGLADRGPEQALLGAAAALALFRRAGRRAVADPNPLPEAAGPDDRTRCSAASDGHLALMLSGTYQECLGEWLDALAESGKRIDDVTLPRLLTLGRAQTRLRAGLHATIGPLGGWLARQNPEWSYALGAEQAVEPEADAVSAWQIGTTATRAALLRRLRESDPAQARDLVASTWSVDGPSDRSAFLEAMAIGLSPDDEPFLEAALDDRRKEVRTVAADLLPRLPDSRLVRRMVDRLSGLIRLEPGGAGEPPSFAVTLPESCDKGMVRDGIEPKNPHHKLGKKAGWLYEMTSRVPPSAWSTAWSFPPDVLAEAVVRNEWHDALCQGLIESAIRLADTPWINALLAHRRRLGRRFDLYELFPTFDESAMLALIASDDEQYQIGGGASPLTDEQLYMLQRTPGPWGVELSRLVLDRIARNLADPSCWNYPLSGFALVAARCLPPALVLANPPYRKVTAGETNDFKTARLDDNLANFHAQIQFRHDMIEELRR